MLPVSNTVQRRHLPWVTWVLIGANVWVFLVELLVEPGRRVALIGRYALVPAEPTATTFLTHMFLHLGLIHLVANVWVLWLFGGGVEDRLGSIRFLVFYLLCGLAAAGMHVKNYEDSYVPIVGASGAIAGVMGAFLFLFPRARVQMLGRYGESVPAYIFLGGWFALQVYSGWDADRRHASGGVAWWAHVGGFMTGCLLVQLFVRRDRWSRRNPGYAEE